MAKGDKFLQQLLASGHSVSDPYTYSVPKPVSQTPVPSYAGTSFNFASYFNSKAAKMNVKPGAVGLASQGHQDERGVLSKTFGWLGSLGTGVENVILDTVDPKTNSDSGTIAKNIGRDIGAALTHAVQPIIDLGPLHTPWENKVANFTYKYNVQHGGKEFTSGAQILKDLGVSNKWARYGGGFGIDVLTDPLSYIGIGLPGKFGKAKKALEAATDAVHGTEGEKAAVAVEKGRQAAQEAGFARPVPGPTRTVSPVVNRLLADTKIGEDLSVAKQGAKGADIVPMPRPRLNPGLAQINLGKDIALTKGGHFNPLSVQKVINNIARQGGTLAPVPSPIAPVTGLRAVQAIKSAAPVLNKLDRKVLKPKDQANLFNHLFHQTIGDRDILRMTGNKAETPEALHIRNVHTVPQLKAVEDALAGQGYEFHDWNGSGLKLSDVMAEVPKERFVEDLPKVVKAFEKPTMEAVKDPNVQEYAANALARRNLAVGTAAKDMYDKMAIDAAAQQVQLSPARYRDWLNGTADKAYAAARPMGFTETEANAFKDLFKSHATLDEVDMMDSYDLIDHIGPKLARAFYEGNRDDKLISEMNKALAKGMGIPAGKAGKILKPVMDVEESMARRLTTWYGRGSEIHKARSEFSAAQNWAKARNDWIGHIRKDYTEEEVNKAWAATMRPVGQAMEAEGLLDEKSAELSQKFKDYIENIIGKESPLGKIATESTAINSQMVAQDLNRHLKAVGSQLAIKPDKNGNWLDSVYNFKVLGKKSDNVDPTTFLYNFDLAIQRTLAEYNLVDDFAMRFGAKPGDRAFDSLHHTHEVPHGRLEGYKFPKQTAQEFTQLLEDLRKGSWRPSTDMTRLATEGLRRWKGGVTIYYPAHHIRNLIGDTWLMWASGINDPRVFNKALKIIGSQRTRYKDAIKDPNIATLQSMIDGEGTGWAATEGRKIISQKGGISADEYYHEALKRGVLLDAQRIEDIQGEALTGGRSLTRPFGGELHHTISQISEMREHYVRLAHLVGYVEKHMPASVAKKLEATEGPLERSQIMSDLMDQAAQNIRKWHPDGTDLTYWEQKYMRNVAPFYSWTRKAFPLLLESMMLKPAKVMAYSRAMFALQGSLGIAAPGPTQPFPEDQLYPDWLVGGGIGPIGDPQSNNPFTRWFGVMGTNAVDPNTGQETGYTIWDPGRGSLPASMIGQIFGMGTGAETWKGLMDMSNPLFRVPAELATGHQTSGAPIRKADNGNGVLSYLMSVMPQTAPIQRFTQVGKQGQADREPGPNWESLFNALTGAGVTGTGKYTKSAEFDLRDRQRREKNK